jgi:hypothetical protein
MPENFRAQLNPAVGGRAQCKGGARGLLAALPQVAWQSTVMRSITSSNGLFGGPARTGRNRAWRRATIYLEE